MPKKQGKETQTEQSARFRKAVREMVAAGELSPTEADEALNKLVRISDLHQAKSHKND